MADSGRTGSSGDGGDMLRTEEVRIWEARM